MAKDKGAQATSEGAPGAEARDRARDQEEAKQAAIVQAVFDATHDEAGEPIPIVPPEPGETA